jgi:CRP/FNR family transcriptional regulator
METMLALSDSTKKKEILERYSFFRDAGYSLQLEILSNANTAVLKPGVYFFQPGSQVNQFALVGSGSVRVFVVSEGGREVTLYRVRPGESCPINILSILLNRKAPAIAIVESLLHAVVIDSVCLRKWVSEYSVFRQYVFETFASRMVDVLSLLEDIKFRKLETRLAEYLASQLPVLDSNSAVINITHERLAAELGSAREVITRRLREFERLGIVELARGKIFVNNNQALRKVIGE